MKIGFIGLGSLGRAIAGRLAAEGVDLVVWNRTASKADGLKAEIAQSPADLITKSDMVFICLFDSEAVRHVIVEPQGVLGGQCRGKVIVDLTTNHFIEVLRFKEYVDQHGAHYLESPVAGSVIPATQGNLTVFVSGSEDAFHKAKPFLDKIGKTIHYLREPGLATRMKLINNLILGNFMATISEAIVLAERAGVDKERAIEMLASGAGNSGVFSAKKQKFQDEDFTVHFASRTIYKDLHYLQDLSRELNHPLMTGSVVKELFGIANAKGHGNDDFAVVYKVLKGLSE